MLPVQNPFASVNDAALFNGHTLPITNFLTDPVLGTQPQLLLNGPLRAANLASVLPFLCSTNNVCSSPFSAGFLPNSVQLQAINSIACLNPTVFYPATVGHLTVSPTTSAELSSSQSEKHTIIRAPVLYRNGNATDSTTALSTDTLRTKENETSPPDRIVASYAAAAHAAALANHQPVSKAAEVFLSPASSGGRSRHTKRPRAHVTGLLNSVVSRSNTDTSTSTVSVSPPTSTTSPSSKCDSAVRRSDWRRIVDRNASQVTYISPDGIRLQNLEQVYAYFNSAYPRFADGKRYEDMIASCFVFEPTTEATVSEDGLSLLCALKPVVNPDSPSDASISATDKSSTQLDVSTTSSGAASTVCRISFNPNHSANQQCIVAKRSRLDSPTNATYSDSSNEESHVNCSSTSTVPVVSTISESKPCAAVQPSPSIVAQTVVDERISPPTVESVCSSATYVPSDLTGEKFPASLAALPTESTLQTHVETPSFSANALTSHISDDGINIDQQSTPVDASITKMTTETLTTGTLHNPVPSCGMPMAPLLTTLTERARMHPELNMTDFASLVQQQMLLQGAYANSNNAHQQHLLQPLLSNQRLSEAHHQQQQFNAIIAALSANSHNATAPVLVNNNPDAAAQLLSAQSHNTTPWSTGLPSAAPWSSLNPNSVSQVAAYQQQVLALAALQQQQQQQAVAAAAQTALLHHHQQQQALLAQQQQQSAALHSVAQLQNCLAALQHFPSAPQ